MSDDAEIKDLYHRMLIVLRDQNATISNAIVAALDVVYTCIINEQEGDIKGAIVAIEEALIPMIKDFQKKLEAGDVSLVNKHIEQVRASIKQVDNGTNPLLANLDITDKRAN